MLQHPMRWLKKTRRLWLLAGLAWALAGCALSAGDRPVDVPRALARLEDPAQPVAWRLKTLEALISAARTQPAVAEALAGTLDGLLWSAALDPSLQRAGMVWLCDRDAETFWRQADRRVLALKQWANIEALCALAIERDHQAFVPTAVRSWARPSRSVVDSDRPEARAVARLRPGQSPAAVLVALLLGEEPAERDDHAMAAWQVLVRLDAVRAGDLVAHVRAAPSMDDERVRSVLRDLAMADAVLGQLPAEREGLLWLAFWLRPAHAAGWDAVVRTRAMLSASEQAAVRLRHLGMLARPFASMPTPTRGERVARLTRQLPAEAVLRSIDAIEDPHRRPDPQDLATALPAISDLDLLQLETVLMAMREPAVVAALFAQADADHQDTTSEHGGVLGWDAAGQWEARAFPPIWRGGDDRFYPSDAMIAALYTGLAHYHFHAQQHAHAAYAGPGAGDFAFVERMGCAALVLTFIDRDRLNVDFQLPGRIVIDLGVLERP